MNNLLLNDTVARHDLLLNEHDDRIQELEKQGVSLVKDIQTLIQRIDDLMSLLCKCCWFLVTAGVGVLGWALTKVIE